MIRFPSDVAFSPAVKAVQEARGSRRTYARVERDGGFETAVTDELRAFLLQVDTAFLGTASADGQPYVQHRGGPKGFIRALGGNKLGFLDFSGNRQYVSTGNLTENPRVCLFLMDYARRQRVKIWGTAELVIPTPELEAALALPADYPGRPERALVLTVTAWDINCPQHIPQKVDAADVAPVLERLRERVAQLEEENRRLRADCA